MLNANIATVVSNSPNGERAQSLQGSASLSLREAVASNINSESSNLSAQQRGDRVDLNARNFSQSGDSNATLRKVGSVIAQSQIQSQQLRKLEDDIFSVADAISAYVDTHAKTSDNQIRDQFSESLQALQMRLDAFEGQVDREQLGQSFALAGGAQSSAVDEGTLNLGAMLREQSNQQSLSNVAAAMPNRAEPEVFPEPKVDAILTDFGAIRLLKEPQQADEVNRVDERSSEAAVGQNDVLRALTEVNGRIETRRLDIEASMQALGNALVTPQDGLLATNLFGEDASPVPELEMSQAMPVYEQAKNLMLESRDKAELFIKSQATISPEAALQLLS